MDKRTFKICEAVALGLTHYYMGPHDKCEVTAIERAEALATISMSVERLLLTMQGQ